MKRSTVFWIVGVVLFLALVYFVWLTSRSRLVLNKITTNPDGAQIQVWGGKSIFLNEGECIKEGGWNACVGMDGIELDHPAWHLLKRETMNFHDNYETVNKEYVWS